MDYKAIKNLAESYTKETAKLLSRMIQTPSFSGKEADMVKLLKREMEDHGFDDVRIDGLGSVIGKIGNGKRIIAFDAHIDTVYPGDTADWNFPPHSGMIDKDRVWGRGSSDQLGGMAAMLTAGKIIRKLGLNKEFTILFTGTVMEEDCDGIAWEYLIEEEGIKPELVVSTEPTSLNIYRGHRGRMEIEVEVKGVSCHGSAPERGVNAIYKMASIVKEIEKLPAELKDDDFLGKGTITTTIFKSDSASQCSVPDRARILLDRRLTVGENKESSVAEVRACCDRAGISDAEITVPLYEEKAYTGKIYPVEKYFPTWVLPKDSLWLKSAEEAYINLFDKAPKIDKWTFSTNCVFIMGKHPEIKCLGLGPGDEDQAHAVNESVKISDLWQAAAFYAGLVAKLNEG
ncbi:MAG: YgeY family selenium metabolism-linked hydrolase [Candidatus Stygibacter australis]|nr:YgeY family selenium metabolism-linked hydrolase [Candidatus Stygibacter australis]MDP8321962.1 YgeY family selenium metabolism-linked hydrolase [Candidatus Stygibacter australis]